MRIDINGQAFDTTHIQDITITDSRVLVDYKDDYIIVSYSHPDEIQSAVNWVKVQNLSQQQLKEAIAVIALVCDNHINTYNQCADCPLFRGRCILQLLPIDWSEDDNKIIGEK